MIDHITVRVAWKLNFKEIGAKDLIKFYIFTKTFTDIDIDMLL